MAKKKTSVEPDAKDTPVEDAVVIEETSAPDAEKGSAEELPVADGDIVAEDTPADDDPSASGDAAEEVQDAQTPMAPAPEPVVVQRKGGFVPMVLGGLVAGGIGYGAATYLPEYLNGDAPDPLASVESAQSELQSDVAALSADVSALAATPAVPDLSSDVADLSTRLTDISDQIATLEASATQINDRITVLEKRPLTEVVAPEAIAAYNAELQALRDSVAAQLDDVTNVADAARAEITTAKEQAAALEQSAVDAARLGAAQSALNSIAAALASGGGYADTLAVLQENSDIAVPDILTENATDGVPTQAALQEQFPDLARAALAAARVDAPREEGESGLGAFFRSQLNVRSLSPQEGSGPDAVLSRAEAAVKTGAISDALEEIAALPSSAKDILAPWVNQANTRADAQRAAADMAAQLSQN